MNEALSNTPNLVGLGIFKIYYGSWARVRLYLEVAPSPGVT